MTEQDAHQSSLAQPARVRKTVYTLCSETYQYYNLPFCTPKDKEYKPEGLGEVLEGDRLVNTPYDIKFRVDKENELLCSRDLTAKDLQKFRKAVKKDYYFQVGAMHNLVANETDIVSPSQNHRSALGYH